MSTFSEDAENVYNRDQLLKTYAMLDANSVTAKMLLAEVGRLSTIIDIKTTLAALSTGRLLADNETPFTAEQMEDVRTVSNCALQYGDSASGEAAHRLLSLFPATKPAEVNSNICTERNSSTPVDEGRESGGRMDRHTCIPAPAEPAEEETKAERCPSEIEGWGCSLTTGHDGDHTAYDQDGPAYVWPASSPVVPAPTETEFERGVRAGINEYRLYFLDENEGAIYAEVPVAELDRAAEGAIAGALRDNANRADAPAPTETGPWPSLDAVPADVHTVRDKSGDEYRRRKNGGWTFNFPKGPRCKITLPIAGFDQFAPFVATEEG